MAPPRPFRLTPPRAPVKRPLVGPEAGLQIAIVEHLKTYGVKHLIYYHCANEGLRSEAYGAMLKRMGLLPGVADLFVGVPGSPPSWLEVKRPGYGQTLEQRAFEALVHCNGGRYAVVNNIDHALSVLHSWGALRTSEAA